MRGLSTGRRWGIAVVTIAAITVAGIGTPRPTSALPARTLDAHAGTIVYADTTGNPLFSPLNYCCTSSATFSALYAHLLRIAPNGRLAPDLLANVPSVENHEVLNRGRTIVLKLKPHQYWSSGAEITARDIRFGWRVYMDPATSTSGKPYACQDTCDRIASISVRNRYVAVLHLKHPYAPFLSCCLPPIWPHQWRAMGMPPHRAALYIADWGVDPLSSKYWTDGPFRVRSSKISGDTVMTRIKGYHAHPDTHVSRLIHRFFEQVGPIQALVGSAVKSGVDVVVGSLLEPDDRPNTHRGTYRIELPPSFEPVVLEFNVLDRTYTPNPYSGQDQWPGPTPTPTAAGEPPVPNVGRNLRLRQALALAIDRPRLIQAALHITSHQASALAAYSPLLATKHVAEMFADRSIDGAWDPVARRFMPYGRRALRDARTLLRQAGYPHGFDIEVTAEWLHSPMWSVLSDEWAKIGVRTTLIPLPAQFTGIDFSGILAGHFEAFVSSVQAGPDPDVLRSDFDPHLIYRIDHKPPIYSGGGGLPPQNVSGIQDQLIVTAMQKGHSTIDARKRAAWYRKAQQEIIRKAYWIPLYYTPYVLAVSPRVRGVTEAPDGSVYTDSWRIAP